MSELFLTESFEDGERTKSPLLIRAKAAGQVFVDETSFAQEVLQLGEDDSHHLSRVLRLGARECVVATDGKGHWRLCRYVPPKGSRNSAHLEAIMLPRFEAAEKPSLSIGCALVKGDRSDWMVQKLTEIGIDCITPLISERSVVRWEKKRAELGVSRFQRVAKEAAAQSRRVWLPRISKVSSLADWAMEARTSLGDGALGLADLGCEPVTSQICALGIGPEGGWGKKDRALGILGVGLSNQVLRSETAAVVGGALLVAMRSGNLPNHG